MLYEGSVFLDFVRSHSIAFTLSIITFGALLYVPHTNLYKRFMEKPRNPEYRIDRQDAEK